MPSKIFFFILFFASLSLSSQNENSQWCFGYNVGINFMNNPPSVQARKNGGHESCSSISDGAGNLKIYTDGISVYNGNHQFMAGSSSPNLIGGGNKQGVILVKQPGNNPYYYIFVSSSSGLRYSIVDISLAAGMGSVTTKNILIASNTMAYKCTATWHCNKKDLWIVTQEQGTDISHAVLLTSAGINPPVLSKTSLIHNVYSCMKFSPDGSKLASTEWGNGIRLYEFNRLTGAVSGGTVVSGQGNAAWGIEFSPDGSKLYSARFSKYLLQWDLNAGSASAISASQYTVHESSGFAFNDLFGQIQLAPNGKIYCCRDNSSFLATINNPNAQGAACNFILNGISTAPMFQSRGLPNQVKPLPPLPLISYTFSNCFMANFAIKSVTLGGVSSVISLPVSWNFDDPLSGGNNNSSLTNPVHTFSGPGTYGVYLVVYSACSTDTIRKTVYIPNTAPNLSITGNSIICNGSSTTLTASGANSYSWSTANGLLGTGPVILITPVVSGVYSVIAANTGGTCTAVKTISISIKPSHHFELAGNFNICAGQATTLSVRTSTVFSSFTWIPGNIISSSVIVQPQNDLQYTVTGLGTDGCFTNRTAFIKVESPVALNLNPMNASLCEGENTTLSASGALTYFWQPAKEQSPEIIITPTSTTIYTVTGKKTICTSTKTVEVVVENCSTWLGLTNVASPVIKSDNELYRLTFTVTAVNTSSETLKYLNLENHLASTLPWPCTYSIIGLSHGDITKGTLKLNSLYDGRVDPGLVIPEESYILPYGKESVIIALILKPNTYEGRTYNSVSGTAMFRSILTSDISNNGYNQDENGDGDPTNDNRPTPVDLHANTFFIPDGFSPNDDGYNDFFVIKGLNGRSADLSVFNRWGEIVFRQSPFQNKWDGAANAGVIIGNGKLPEGAYYYVLRFTDNGESHVGFIQMLY